MTDFVATCAWGRVWPSRSRTQGGQVGKPIWLIEDAEMRSATRVIEVRVAAESVI